MEFRGMMGGLYRISEWIMRLSVINVLWVLCALPFFFLVGTILFVQPAQPIQSLEQLVPDLILIAVVAPFTLFPSTSAMFAVARKWITGEEDAPLLKTFFRGYKDNFVQSMLGGWVYALFAALLYTNISFYSSQEGLLSVFKFLVLTLAALIGVSFFHFFSITTHLHMKFFQIFKNTLLISIGHPFLTLSMLICNGVVFYISFTMFTFLIPFFTGSLVAVVSFWHFNLIFGKLQTKQQALEEKEAAKVVAEAVHHSHGKSELESADSAHDYGEQDRRPLPTIDLHKKATEEDNKKKP